MATPALRPPRLPPSDRPPPAPWAGTRRCVASLRRALLVGLLGLLPACERSEPTRPAPLPQLPPTPSPKSPVPVAAPPSVGPMSFYLQTCSRCHGRFGIMYPDTFQLTGEQRLRDNVARMVTLQGQSHLSALDLTSLIAFHRSLVVEEPFVVVTAVDLSPSGRTILSGEASEGASVTIVIAGSELAAERDAWKWRAEVTASAADLAQGLVRTRRNGKQTTCPLKSGASSHDAPLPRE